MDKSHAAAGKQLQYAPRQRFAALLLGAALTLGASGFAAAQTPAASPGAWQFEVTPYLWMAGLKGDVAGPNLPQTDVNVSFSDIWNVLDFAAMGTFEARKDRWGFFVDGIYMKLSDSMTMSRTGAGPLGATLTANADVTIKQTLMSGGVAYRVLEGRTPVDVIGGLRYVKIQVDGSVDVTLLNLAGSRSRSGDKSWTDAYIGARVQYPIADRWTLTGYADAGGSSGSSTWQAALGASYDYSKDIAFRFGYRALNLDYNKDGFLFNATMSGPYLAAAFRF